MNPVSKAMPRFARIASNRSMPDVHLTNSDTAVAITVTVRQADLHRQLIAGGYPRDAI
jgi:hypothetical protein